MNTRIDLLPRLYRIALVATVAVAPLCSAFAGAPIIASGKQVATVHIPQQVTPTVTLNIRGDSQRVYFQWQASNLATLFQQFTTSLPTGKYVFQGVPGYVPTFGPYTISGTWTLMEAGVCSYKWCTDYTGSELAALFPSLAVQVINPKADTNAPTVSGGAILTPTAAISRHSTFEANLTVQDDVSGVIQAALSFSNGSKRYDFVIGGTLTTPVVASVTVPLLAVCDCHKSPAGAYNVIQIFVMDVAGNRSYISDPATISSLLGGQTSITLTN